MNQEAKYPKEDIYYRGYRIQMRRIWSVAEGDYKYAAWIVPTRIELLDLADYTKDADQTLLAAFANIDKFLEQQEKEGLVIDGLQDPVKIIPKANLSYRPKQEG